MKHIIWIIICILVSGVAFAADIYASNRTSGGSGTFGDPYALTTALSTATAGDTVYLFSGNYTTGGGYYTSNSGTDENNRLIIQGYNSSDKPTLIGNTSIVTQVLDIPTEYTTIKNIIVREYSEGRRTIRITGNHVTLDGVESYYMGSNYSSGNHNINVYSASYLIFNNSLIDRSTRNGLYISTNYPSGYSDNCTIENSEFRNLEDHHAINIFPDTTDNPVLPITGCVIRNNYFHDLPTQSAMFLRHFKDFQIYNNIIVNAGEGISISSGDNETPTESYEANGFITNNIFVDIVNGYAINNWVANNLTIKNNIFTGDFYSDNVIQFNENYVDVDTDDPPIFNHDINNNIYWNTTGGISWDWNGTVYSTLAAFTAATGQDADSYYGDPLFVNSSVGDYNVNETSYVVDNGFNFSTYFNYDYDYILRPRGNGWDIGPYESNYTLETPTTPSVNITRPLNNQNFLENENITINISASDPDGNISYIEIYANNTLIGNLTLSPYSFIWNETGTGIYTIYANAYDNDSQNTTSTSVIIRVNMTNDAVSGVYFNDTFTDIDGTDLSTHTPNYGSGWIYGYQAGAYSVADINTNRIDYTGSRQVNSGYIAIANDTVPVADYNVTVTVVTHDTTTDTHTIVARWQNSSNFYAFIDSRVSVTSSHGIWKVVSGVNTQINSSGCGLPNNGDIKTLEVRDDLIIAYRNGVQVCNATDSDITQPGKGGFGHGATPISTGDDLDTQVSDNFLISYIPENSSSSMVHYVDNTASGNNDGTSWTDAWENFTSINWSSINPGDTIYISGGTTNQTYNETLNVEQSGNSTHNITITSGIDSGFDGEVIFEGDGTGTGISIDNQQWVVLANLTVTNWSIGINIDGGSAEAVHHIVVDNIDGMMAGRFIFIEGWPDTTGSYAHNITIRNCNVTTDTNESSQTDFVYAQYMAGLTIENNHVVISNENPDPHCDHVQTFWVDGPVIVRNNYFEHADHKDRNSQGIFFENYEGLFEIYNNIVVQSNDNLDAKIYFKSSTLNNASTIIVGNTIYASSGDLIYTTDANATIKNNIIFSTGFIATGTTCMVRGATFGAGSDINYNLYYDPTDSMTEVCSGSIGINSVEGDPEFVNLTIRDFKLQSTSLGVNTGDDLGSPYNITIDGIERPQGAGWDMGAYETSDNDTNTSNSLPTVNITYPLNHSVFENNSNITVNATATDSDGNISYVEFYANNTIIGNDTINPYIILWENVTIGNYYIIAKAYDNDSNYTISDEIYITINLSSNSSNSTANSSENETLEIIIPEELFDEFSNLTNKTRGQLENLQHLHFRNSYGRINFTDNITINRSINLTGQIIITNGSIYINSSYASEFNVSANLEFYNVTYQYPIAYRDGIICSEYCSNQTYNSSSELFYFMVSGFSNYSIENAACGDGSCNAIETCDTCSADCGICENDDNDGGGGGGGGGGGSSYYPIITNTTNQTNSTSISTSIISKEDTDTSISSNQEINNYPEDNSNIGISEISTEGTKEPTVQKPINILQSNIKYSLWIISILIFVLLSAYITMVSQLKNKEKNQRLKESKVRETILKTQEYYYKMCSNGKTDSQVADELRKVGWTDKQIEYVFSKIKKI